MTNSVSGLGVPYAYPYGYQRYADYTRDAQRKYGNDGSIGIVGKSRQQKQNEKVAIGATVILAAAALFIAFKKGKLKPITDVLNKAKDKAPKVIKDTANKAGEVANEAGKKAKGFFGKSWEFLKNLFKKAPKIEPGTVPPGAVSAAKPNVITDKAINKGYAELAKNLDKGAKSLAKRTSASGHLKKAQELADAFGARELTTGIAPKAAKAASNAAKTAAATTTRAASTATSTAAKVGKDPKTGRFISLAGKKPPVKNYTTLTNSELMHLIKEKGGKPKFGASRNELIEQFNKLSSKANTSGHSAGTLYQQTADVAGKVPKVKLTRRQSAAQRILNGSFAGPNEKLEACRKAGLKVEIKSGFSKNNFQKDAEINRQLRKIIKGNTPKPQTGTLNQVTPTATGIHPTKYETTIGDGIYSPFDTCGS